MLRTACPLSLHVIGRGAVVALWTRYAQYKLPLLLTFDLN